MLELLTELYRFRSWLLVCALVPAVLAVGYWYVAAREYRAVVVLEDADRIQDRSGLSGLSLPAGLSGIASLVGISPSSKKEQALAILRSRLMASRFIQEKNLFPELFANKWDSTGMKWQTRSGLAPSMEKAIRRFHRRVLRVERDLETGLIRLEIRSNSRELAALWANEFVAMADARMRERALAEANERLAYLWKEIERATQVESRQVVAHLIQTEINNSMLASVGAEFSLRVLDPAVVPDADDYVWPRLSMLVVVSTVIGLIFGLATAAVRRRLV